MRLNYDYLDHEEAQAQYQLNELVTTLRLDAKATEDLDEAVARINHQMLRALQQQFGSLMMEKFGSSKLKPLLLELAHSVGSIVNSARSIEALHASQEATRNMLAGLAAGAFVTLRNPAEGEGIVGAFGGLLPQEETSETER